MSVLIIVDGESTEQVKKLAKLSTLIGKDKFYISGYKLKRELIDSYSYVALNTNEYIDKLFICEVLIFLTEKISFSKYNQSQIVISWFDRETMKSNFNYVHNDDRIEFISKYKLDVLIGVEDMFPLVDSYLESEYTSILDYIKGVEYNLNVITFDIRSSEEAEIIQSKELFDSLLQENRVNLLLYQGACSSYLLSNFDCIINNNNSIIKFLEEKFSVENLRVIDRNYISIINDNISKSIKISSKKTLYLKKLDSQKDSVSLPLVSIIIPHYNTEMDILCRAIDSVLNNKYVNIEIIIVDDGSQKEVENELLELYNHHEKIKIVRKENAGLGLARNTGIEESQGKYVFLLDSDDIITMDGLFYLVLHAELHNLEMVTGIVAIVDDYGIPMNLSLKYLYGDTYISYEPKDANRVFYAQMAHGKLLKRSLFTCDGIWFESGVYEDSPWSMDLYSSVKHHDFLNIVSNHWYKYEERETLSSKATVKNFKERYRSYLKTIKKCDEKTTFHKTNFWFTHELNMYFENYNNFTFEEKEAFFNLINEFMNIKGKYLNSHINFTKSKLVRSIDKNDFKKFEDILHILYGDHKLDNQHCDNYIVLTHYQLTVAILHTFENKRPVRLYLNTGYVTFSKEFARNLEETGLFIKVIIFEGRESGKLIDELSKCSEDAQYIIPTVLYSSYKGIFIDIKSTENIYVFNSALPYWYYIERINKNIIKVEDGYDSIKNETSGLLNHGLYLKRLKNHIPTIYPDSALNLAKKIIISKEYNKINDKLKDKISIVDTKDLILKYQDKYHNILKVIYPIKKITTNNGLLIITQPLDKLLYCTPNDKITLYKKMISEYKCRGLIYIKPHPADDYPYQEWKGVSVLDKDIPLEVYEIYGFKCTTAVTFGSTAIDTITFAKNKIIIYTDIEITRDKVKEKIQEYIANYVDIPIKRVLLTKVKKKLKKIKALLK